MAHQNVGAHCGLISATSQASQRSRQKRIGSSMKRSRFAKSKDVGIGAFRNGNAGPIPPAVGRNHGSHQTLAARYSSGTVSYTHLRAHETPEHLVCRLLLEKKK